MNPQRIDTPIHARNLRGRLIAWTTVLALIAVAACGDGGGSSSTGSAAPTTTLPATTPPATTPLATTGVLVVDSKPLVATPVPDTARAVVQTVPVTGGTLTATGADGTVYTLTVPADALLQATEITMTPLSSLGVPELDITGATYGVQLGPQGETFHSFVTLTIAPPLGASVPLIKQLPVGWSGALNTVELATLNPDPAIIQLKLLHFSGYGLLLATTGMDATMEPARHRFGGEAEARLQSIAAERITRTRRGQLLGADEQLILDDLFQQYDEQVVKPRVAAARSSCAAGRLAIQTVLGAEHQRQLLGMPGGGALLDALIGQVMVDAAFICTEEEYKLCRDNHIITRIFPFYLGMRRQAELLGINTSALPLPPWLQDVEAAVDKCLNFELQFDSRMDYTFDSGNPVRVHTVSETVTARVLLPFNLGAALFGGGILGTGPFAPLNSLSYSVAYSHSCAQVTNSHGVNAQMAGLLGFEAKAGDVVQRAQVKDFLLIPAVQPNGAGSGYTLTTRRIALLGCDEVVDTGPENENWVNNGATVMAKAFIDRTFGMAIREWTIVGSDIMATKSVQNQESDTSGGNTVVTTDMVLFHKPAP